MNLIYPKNSLTKYLWELRDYRPLYVQNYINHLRKTSSENDVVGFAVQDSTSSALMLRSMHLTFGFRNSHWSMVRKYIIDNTKYPRATGGTPITTWLPNQMGASLEFCQQLLQVVKEDQLSGSLKEDYQQRKN